MKMKAKSKIAKSVYQTAEGMYKAGAISEEALNEFKSLCLSPVLKPIVKPLKAKKAA